MYYSHPSLLPGLYKFLLAAALFFPVACFSQTGYCHDPLVINQATVCPATYDPLCGCDGITYRNYCEMYYHHGIVYYESGICEPMAIEANPNPVVNSMHLTMILKEKGDATLRIFDLYGKTWYLQQFRGIDKLVFDIEVRNFPAGLYFMHGQNGGFSVIRRFIKIPTH